jgi:hypothetical protein
MRGGCVGGGEGASRRLGREASFLRIVVAQVDFWSGGKNVNYYSLDPAVKAQAQLSNAMQRRAWPKCVVFETCRPTSK